MTKNFSKKGSNQKIFDSQNSSWCNNVLLVKYVHKREDAIYVPYVLHSC